MLYFILSSLEVELLRKREEQTNKKKEKKNEKRRNKRGTVSAIKVISSSFAIVMSICQRQSFQKDELAGKCWIEVLKRGIINFSSLS